MQLPVQPPNQVAGRRSAPVAPHRACSCATPSTGPMCRACVLDPGYVPLQQDARDAALDEEGGVIPFSANMGLCATCEVVRPLRSKHCNACKRCASPPPCTHDPPSWLAAPAARVQAACLGAVCDWALQGSGASVLVRRACSHASERAVAASGAVPGAESVPGVAAEAVLLRRCVQHFDHHCPVINNCVGARNQRHFVGYVLLLFLANALFLHLVRPGRCARTTPGFALLQARASAGSPAAHWLPATLIRAQRVHAPRTHVPWKPPAASKGCAQLLTVCRRALDAVVRAGPRVRAVAGR